MNLLKEDIAQQTVVKTPLTRKLTVGGLTKAYPVYKVRLDCLFYNDQNDRIATWISQYKAQHEGKVPDSTNRESYNSIIEHFIVESNPDALRKTQKNMELFDQREPGVVLTDGRIIDGNRRFTCLRRLAEKMIGLDILKLSFSTATLNKAQSKSKCWSSPSNTARKARWNITPSTDWLGFTMILFLRICSLSKNMPEAPTNPKAK